jgi:hypothetical protein
MDGKGFTDAPERLVPARTFKMVGWMSGVNGPCLMTSSPMQQIAQKAMTITAQTAASSGCVRSREPRIATRISVVYGRRLLRLDDSGTNAAAPQMVALMMSRLMYHNRLCVRCHLQIAAI